MNFFVWCNEDCAFPLDGHLSGAEIEIAAIDWKANEVTMNKDLV